MPTHSISVRLRRTVQYSVHVSVPVDADVMAENPEGGAKLDAAKVFARAIELGSTDRPWVAEGEPVIEIHPLQTPPDPR